MTTPTAIEYALMAGAVYQNTKSRINWIPAPTGWVEAEHKINQGSGFEVSQFRNGTNIVISFAGTGPGFLFPPQPDWVANSALALGALSQQLKDAADYYLQVKALNPTATITLTGHSLGGGLASLIAVMFNEQATTFDQAPFAKSALTYTTTDANGNSVTHSVAQDLLNYLSTKTGPNGQLLYSGTRLQALVDFTNASVVNSGVIPNAANVSDINVHGEILSVPPVSALSRIGMQADLWQQNNMLPVVGNADLHSQALLTAMLQSGDLQTAVEPTGTPRPHTLGQASYVLTDLLKMIFDPNLFYNDPNNTSPDAPANLLEHLVRHQTGGVDGVAVGGDGMVTRFTSDLWKLAEEAWNTHNISNALIAFAMQKYYEETSTSTGAGQELFTDLTVSGAGSNGIRFDMHDVSKDVAAAMDSLDPNAKVDLTKAKGYKDFLTYIDTSLNLSSQERTLIKSLLPQLRDWYVQAGTSGMAATDALNRGAFMLGGTGTDNLTGGSKTDLLVGNAGDDTLKGGTGNDTLIGGAGNDTYIWNTGDGFDTILDSDGNGALKKDNLALAGGAQLGDNRVFKSGDHTYAFITGNAASGGDLLIDNTLLIKNYQPGAGNRLGLNFTAAVAAVDPITTNTIQGDKLPDGTPGAQKRSQMYAWHPRKAANDMCHMQAERRAA